PPVDSVVAAAQLVPRSLLEHQKNNLWHELIPDKEESLKDLYAQKSRCVSYSPAAENSLHGGFCSAGLQSKYLTSQTNVLPAKPAARQKDGVDRAYPLTPIHHHKGVSVPVVNTAQLRSCPYTDEAPNSRPSSKGKEKPPAGRSQPAAVLSPWTTEPKQPASQLYRSELACILKLEADGQNLGEKIRKKEAHLLKKLRRTQEVLRKIQREKELAEAEQRRDRDAEDAHEQKVARHPEEKTLRVAVSPGDRGGVFSEAQSAEATIPKPGTTLYPQEQAMGKLKKERLVAINSKIQDRIPMERLASCSELGLKHRPPLSALPGRGAGDHPSAEVLYTKAASAAEQDRLEQCSFCRRKFLCTRLEKHMSICGKSQESKREVFDSRNARTKGTAMQQYQYQNPSERLQNKPSLLQKRPSSWRQQHAALIQTLRQARQVQQVLSKGGKVSDLPPLPPIENPDYVACPYCSRRFAPRAAERHIPKCKSIRNRPPPPLQRRR
ncbi:ZC21C protein, partial [Nyctibius bracteatus]|nr:ZC21C protein [Nyctibius bracteatus]